MINLKIGGIIVAAFIAGAFVASPELRAYAANTVGSSDIIDESILSRDIKNGQVKSIDIGHGEVRSADIRDGTIKLVDVSESAVKMVHLEDCDCGGTDWDPSGASVFERVTDDAVTLDSVISISMYPNFSRVCSTGITFTGSFDIECDATILDGQELNYVIFNKQ
jgi:hypothetical protein